MKKFLPRTLVALPLMLALGLTGCGDSEETGGDGATVSVDGFRFEPPTLEVSTGTAVTWNNDDAINHTATAGTPDEPEESTFDIDLPDDGATGSHTFEEAGTYPYFCEVHPSMLGEIVVTD